MSGIDKFVLSKEDKGNFIPHVMFKKEALTYTAAFEERISRFFIFRKFLLIVEIWVLIVWGIWIGILSFLHFWYMLILGMRSKTIWQKQLRFARHVAKWQAYLSTLVNARPKWIEE